MNGTDRHRAILPQRGGRHQHRRGNAPKERTHERPRAGIGTGGEEKPERRDGKRPSLTGGSSVTPRFWSQPSPTPKANSRMIGSVQNAQRGWKADKRAEDRQPREDRHQARQRSPHRQNDHQREQDVEEHLVIERPAQRIDRLNEPVGPRRPGRTGRRR